MSSLTSLMLKADGGRHTLIQYEYVQVLCISNDTITGSTIYVNRNAHQDLSLNIFESELMQY